MTFTIKKVTAREILDSRGNPTVECDITTESGFGRAAVPSGASTGKFEAIELRDGEKRYKGLGVRKAVANVNSIIAGKITGKKFTSQEELDGFLVSADGTKDKSKLGANALLSVSMAAAKAAAAGMQMPLYRHLETITGKKKPLLPIPFSNVINGGKHAEGKLKLQEFMIVPEKFKSFSEAIAAVAETYHTLKKIIAQKHGKSSTHIGDEGGFAPALSTAEEALDLLQTAVAMAGYEGRISFALDAAASEFYNEKSGKYELERDYSGSELVDYYMKLIRSYNIVSVEDPFNQEDFASFSELTKKSGIQVVGDDLLVTNTERIKMAVSGKSCNALLLKVNQIGTLTEAVNAAKLSEKNGWNVMVSHRSGETEDSFIADLSVALACGQIKTGAPARGERTSKYNQLLRIEEELGSDAAYGKPIK